MVLKFLIVVSVGLFFLVGSGGKNPKTEGWTTIERTREQLSPDERKQYDDLKQKRDYAQRARDRQYNEYWDKRYKEVGDNQASSEGRQLDAVIHQGGWSSTFEQGPGAYEFANKIRKIDNHINQIDRQINKLLTEHVRVCFPPETLILMADSTHKAIKEIKIGDQVTVYDIATESIGVSSVSAVSVSENDHFYQINGGIKATAHERFMTKDGWKKIRDITVGDEIFNGNDYDKVSTIIKSPINSTVYNLTVSSSHNFFVSYEGKSNMLVHNSSGGHGGGSSGGSGGGK
jgi:flagellar basal body rod protein FlgF